MPRLLRLLLPIIVLHPLLLLLFLLLLLLLLQSVSLSSSDVSPGYQEPRIVQRRVSIKFYRVFPSSWFYMYCKSYSYLVNCKVQIVKLLMWLFLIHLLAKVSQFIFSVGSGEKIWDIFRLLPSFHQVLPSFSSSWLLMYCKSYSYLVNCQVHEVKLLM